MILIALATPGLFVGCGSNAGNPGTHGDLGASKGTYTPQYISTATYNSIIQGSAESCG